MLYRISIVVARAILKTLFGVKVTGTDNIPAHGGFILASNHLSLLDPAIVAVACPRELNFMAKQELFKIPIFSKYISSVGAFPVKRNSADLSALKEAMKRVRSGGALLLFPEGSRSPGKITGEPQAGVGFLASKIHVPVIPVYVSGTDKALPKGAKFFRPAKVSVQFGKQIPLERRMPYRDIAERIMESIRHLS